MENILKPRQEEVLPYQWNYISLVPTQNDILGELQVQSIETIELITSLDDETLQSRYAPGKWTIMDIMVHLMDCERILAYRALCIARGDKTPLPAFNQDDYVVHAKGNSRKILNLVKEYSLLRASNIELFSSFDAQMWQETGNANGRDIKANVIPWFICGHEIHHRNIIEERYIGK